MKLTDREVDKLLMSLAAMIARDRRARGVKFNYPKAVAVIASGLMERKRSPIDSAAAFAGYGVSIALLALGDWATGRRQRAPAGRGVRARALPIRGRRARVLRRR